MIRCALFVIIVGSVTTAAYAASPDLSRALHPGAGLCHLPRIGERLLVRMTGTKTGALRLPGGMIAKVSVANRRVTSSVTEITRRAEMPAGTTWHGLPLSYIEQSIVTIPESHGPMTRRLAFRTGTERLRAVLAALGEDTPLAPEGRRVEYEPYGARVSVDARGSDAILICQTND